MFSSMHSDREIKKVLPLFNPALNRLSTYPEKKKCSELSLRTMLAYY